MTLPPSLVDVNPTRWPDVARSPHAPLRARVADALLRRIVARLPLRVRHPDGRIDGTSGPVLILHRPEAFLHRLGTAGLIGVGESYQAGDWDADDLTALLSVLASQLPSLVPRQLQWLRHVHGPRMPRSARNTPGAARRNIEHHYDLSNDLFALFLDETMTYSAALFDRPDPQWMDLAPAQHRKIDRLLDATGVGPGRRVLEIGTGWGELAIRAAGRGARVDSVTLSARQRELALRRAAEAGVADRVDVQLCDYREIPAQPGGYDAILSVEMVEAVGERYWPAYFATLDAHLAPHGRAGLQAITMADERLRATRSTYTWIQKYIFPGGLLPSVPAVERVLARHTGLAVTDQHSFGRDYATTLRLWRDRFTEREAELAALGFDDTFARTWRFYLAYCEAGFATDYLDVCQLILARPGMEPA